MPRPEIVLSRIKALQGRQGYISKCKLTVTPIILWHLRGVWKSVGQNYDKIMSWTASMVCFFSFIRVGQTFYQNEGSFGPTYHIMVDNVAPDSRTEPLLIQLTLNGQEQDSLHKGINIILGKTGNSLCPVKTMLFFLRMREWRKIYYFFETTGHHWQTTFHIQIVGGSEESRLHQWQRFCRP